MGYILPIPNYQRQHYHDRLHQPKYDPFPVDRLYPKRIESSYDFITNHKQVYKKANIVGKIKPPSIRGHQRQISRSEKKYYADLTGVGGQINLYT